MTFGDWSGKPFKIATAVVAVLTIVASIIGLRNASTDTRILTLKLQAMRYDRAILQAGLDDFQGLRKAMLAKTPANPATYDKAKGQHFESLGIVGMP